ncbi:MAG: folate-binding protein YgfZ [Deltaproteobacteria bacterium]|nr:folate-binding protein YgfZ [Deltaproteobacteria bacterium]
MNTSSVITRKSSEDNKVPAQALAAGVPPGVLIDAQGVPVGEAQLLSAWSEAAFVPSHGTMPSGALPSTRGFVDLGAAAALRVVGPDRESWLTGVTTADVKAAQAGGAVYSLFLNGRGRVVADGYVFRFADELVITTRPDRLDALHTHLDKLLIMEDAELSRATGRHRLRWVGAPPDASLTEGVRGSPDALGFEVLLTADRAAQVLAQVPERADAGVLETLRIARGIPAWGQDFGEETTPLEAGLDRAIAFNKGCYVGQEVVAMATYRGRVQWNLVRLAMEGEVPQVGAQLDPARGGKGKVTSAAQLGAQAIALGVVHREKMAPGSVVDLADGRKATVLGLPYGSLPGAGVCA